MTMLAEMKFTEVRNNFTSVIDQVQRLSPVVVKPRKQSEASTFLLNEALVQQLLQGITFKVKLFQEEDGSVTLGMDELELYVNGDTEEKAFEELAEDAMVYAQDYMRDPHRYFNAPNRRSHFPYLFKVLLCNNKEEVKQLLKDAELQRS
jgi:hypothetical protein